MDLFLGIDLGTSYFKAGLFDENGRLCGLGRSPVPKQSPGPLVCELPVDGFWLTLRQTIAQALQEAGAEPKQIVSMSYATQANSFVLLDRQHRLLTPLILWPDERAGNVHPDLQAFCKLSAWRVKTGMGIPLSKHSAVNKLLWYQSWPEIFQKVYFLQTISDYFTFILTGQQYSDLSTASLLGLLDVQSGTWWPEAIDCVLPDHAHVGISQRTGTAAGTLTEEGARLLGLSTHTSFYLGGLDHHIASIGAGVHTGNYLSESTGTVLATVGYTNRYLPAETVCVAPGLDTQHYFNMTFDNNGAAFLEWYRAHKAPGLTIPQLLQEAALVLPGSEGLQAAPHARPDETNYSFEGINSRHGHGHFVRAILEATALRLATLANKLDPGTVNNVVSTGGGARSNLWTSIKAAITGRTFIIPECPEAACLGAAMLAATGSGLFNNHEEATTGWVKYRSYTSPDMEMREQYLRWMQQQPTRIPVLSNKKV
jgi:sugar (pentulose or hexulose) kinase